MASSDYSLDPMRDGEFRRTPRCEVIFDGWRSDTYALQSCGWEIAIEDVLFTHVMERALRMVLHHPPSGITLYAVCQQARDMLDPRYQWSQEPEQFVVQRAAARADRMVLVDDRSRTYLEPKSLRRVDALPQDGNPWGRLTFSREQTTVSDLGLFSPWHDPQAIVVDPDTIDTLMTKIRSLQAPELAAIREQNRKREAREQKAERVHAQIITLAA